MTVRPSRRLFRYSLRTMLVLLTAFCVWLGWQVQIVQARKAAVTEIERGGGRCDHYFRDGAPPRLPLWRIWMGDDEVNAATLNTDFIARVGVARMDQIQDLIPEAEITVWQVSFGRPELPAIVHGASFDVFDSEIPYRDWRDQHPDP